MNVLTSSLKQIRDSVVKGEVTAEQVMQKYFAQIEKWNPRINAFVTLNEKALEQAAAIDARVKKKEDIGPLGGVPIAIKDMLCTKGIRTTAGSKILENFIPPFSSTVV